MGKTADTKPDKKKSSIKISRRKQMSPADHME
jgi:hypothetical protein